MRLEAADVLRLGELSRIEIEDHVLEILRQDLNGILDFAAVLQEVDPAAEPYTFDFGGNVLREDAAAGSLDQAAALGVAPAATEDGFFRVPRTVDTGSNPA